MQQLLMHICATYIGTQYQKLVSALFLKPQTLQSLVELSDESYKHLIEKLKYLIKLNIVVFEKFKGNVVYSIDENMVFFFQRIIKYHLHIAQSSTKQQAKILFYFLEVMASNFDSFAKRENIGPQNIPRTKQIFAALIKKGYLYEDQRAIDLQLVQKRDSEPVTQQNQSIQSQQKDAEIHVIQNKHTKRKKKQPIKLEKNSDVPLQFKSNVQHAILLKIQQKQTYFCLSLGFILKRIKDQLIAKRLQSKFSLNKSLDNLIELINLQKYSFPFDFYNQPLQNPKNNLLKDIQTQLLQQYIHLKYGQNSLLVYKTLIDNEYISQKYLLKLTLLQLKPLRSALNPLFVAGIVKSVQLKIQRTNTMVFWADAETGRKQYLVYLTKTCMNLDLVIKKFKEQILREENKGLRTPQFNQKLLKLQANLLDLDDCLILYSR